MDSLWVSSRVLVPVTTTGGHLAKVTVKTGHPKDYSFVVVASHVVNVSRGEISFPNCKKFISGSLQNRCYMGGLRISEWTHRHQKEIITVINCKRLSRNPIMMLWSKRVTICLS